jgi:hypothetical protein
VRGAVVGGNFSPIAEYSSTVKNWQKIIMKRLWASQKTENICYKTKVVSFEMLLLKSGNKINFGHFLTKIRPF